MAQGRQEAISEMAYAQREKSDYQKSYRAPTIMLRDGP